MAPTLRAPFRHRRPRRRGVSSVLSMMFLVIFGSLGAAMAVVAQGNLRTADSATRVSRAMSAAETGLVFAGDRLAKEAARFVIRPGVIDPVLAGQLWRGEYAPSDAGGLVVLPPTGYTVMTPPAGVGQAVLDAHLADSGTTSLDPGDASLPELDPVSGLLACRPMVLGTGAHAPTFRLTYRPVEGTSRIRVISEGQDGEVRRTLQMDFDLDKRIEYAVLSPNRVMVGKNVIIEGPVGTTYGLQTGDLNPTNGHPVVMRSDFRYLDSSLDDAILALAAAIESYDADGDNRLRVNHPLEMVGLTTDPRLVDRNGDEFVDEFDLFLAQFDANGDGRICWDSARCAAAGYGEVDPEFAGVDDQLARLIDLGREDRNADGVLDEEDLRLGCGDGMIDALDRPAKLRGQLQLAVTEEAWESAAEQPWQRQVQGAIRAPGEAPAVFGIPEPDFRVVTTDMFADTAEWFSNRANGDLALQIAQGVAAGGSSSPAEEGEWESVPFGSPNAYDWYQRPVVSGITFHNVRIPRGTNAVFVDCRFEGVTYIDTETECGDIHWNYAGAIERVGEGDEAAYQVRYPDIVASVPGSPDPVPDTRILSNNLRFHGCTFLGSIAGDTPSAYTHWRNKIQFTGPTRLFNRPDDPELLAQPDGPLLAAALQSLGEEDLRELRKSSMMLPGWSVDVGNFANEQADNPEDTARIRMSGTVVAGILDVRGTAEIHGTLLLSFKPLLGQGPLHFGGKTDAFNTTIGYFGPLDGDFEGTAPGEDAFEGFGEILIRWNPEADLPDGIPWPITVVPLPETYREARAEA